ncbi:hypothetical protein I6I99_10025 [Sphingobacterium multivorum]|nr:hypothetical protein [Sphingobacterium multivorum]QQT32871.1 hypothetical protein I6I99_10025 [Sphingobacterium multivorum]
MNTHLGPQVAIIDDVHEEVALMEKALADLNVGFEFFSAKIEENNYPEKPIDSIQLIMLDLYYKNDFDPEICGQWINSIIGDNQKYNLLVWSKDTHEVDYLISTLEAIGRKPEDYRKWQKTDFDLKGGDFLELVRGLVSEINYQNITEEVIKGEIIEVGDDFVLINCLIDEKYPTFQVRRFDKELLANIRDITNGRFVRIQIFSKPGARLFNFFEEIDDHREIFEQKDVFKGLEGSSFFKIG